MYDTLTTFAAPHPALSWLILPFTLLASVDACRWCRVPLLPWGPGLIPLPYPDLRNVPCPFLWESCIGWDQLGCVLGLGLFIVLS